MTQIFKCNKCNKEILNVGLLVENTITITSHLCDSCLEAYKKQTFHAKKDYNEELKRIDNEFNIIRNRGN